MTQPPSPSHGSLWARWALDPALGVLDGVTLEWRGGRIHRLEAVSRPPADLPPGAIFDRHLLTPGLLNAHTHLDYAYMKGMLPRGEGFVPWLRGMIAERRAFADPPRAIEACRRAVADCVAGGVTELWDISSFGWALPALARSSLAGLCFQEWIAMEPARWQDPWAAWPADFARRCAEAGLSAERWGWGLSPHTVYTVCPPALAAAARWAREEGLPCAIHLAESSEERDLLVEGRGALFDLFSAMMPLDPHAALGVGLSSIARVRAAGALGPRTLAIHCNLPEPGEARALAESGAVVVFCPRSHAYFGYPPYPLEAYRQAGVRLALGTDSLASNDSLSIRAEMRRLGELAPMWSPLELLACASGAALGQAAPFGGRGLLQPGRPARWALWTLAQSFDQAPAERLLEALLSERTTLAHAPHSFS